MVLKRIMLISFLLFSLSFVSMACAVSRIAPSTVILSEPTLPLSLPTHTPERILSPTVESPTATPEPTLAPAVPLQALYTDQDNNLWLWQDGSSEPRQLDDSGDVKYGRLSDDGSQAAYVRMPEFSQYSIWLINTDGTDKKELVSYEQLINLAVNAGMDPQCSMPYELQWLPGRDVLSFNKACGGRGLEITGDIFQVDTTSSILTQANNPAQGGLAYYSPDGNRMAVVSPVAVHLANSDGSNLIQSVLSYPIQVMINDMTYYPQVYWSPDSSFFRMIILSENQPPYEPLNAQVWQVNSDGSQPVQVGDLSQIFGFSWRLSPDLSHLLYLRKNDLNQDPVFDLYLAGFDGTEEQLIYPGITSFYNFHPNSRQIIFSKDSMDSAQITLADGTFAPLTDTGFARTVKWVSNDTFLFFNNDSSGWQLRRQTIGNPSEVLVDLKINSPIWPEIDLSGGLE